MSTDKTRFTVEKVKCEGTKINGMSAETQAAKVTNKCFKTSAKNSKSEITKNNNSSNGPEKSKGNGSKGTNFFDGRVGKERKNGVDRLERVEEGGEVEKTKRKLEAENRMLLELLDDTSYNNDLKKPPQKTQCSGDNVGKLCKKVHEVPKEDILVEARSMEQGAETASVKQGVKAEEMREDKREVTTDTKREEKEVKVKLKTSEELKKKLIGRSQSKGAKLFSGVKSDKSEKTGKEKNKKFAKAKSGDDKIGDQEKAIDAKGKVKEVVLEHKRLESSKGEEKGDHEEKVTMKLKEDDEDDVLFASTSSSFSSSLDDDESNDQENTKEYGKGGYHSVRVGSFYNDHYQIVRKVGWGYFSTVWLSWDTKNRRYVALKIVKSGWEFADAAKDEIKLLRCVAKSDSSDKAKNRVVQMFDNFKFDGFHGKHQCLVMEVMGPNLLRLLVQSKQRGLPLVNVKIIMYQVLEGLRYLHEKCKIIHTDLKPENILVIPQQAYVSFSAAHLIQSIKDPSNISANMISSQQYEAIKVARVYHKKSEIEQCESRISNATSLEELKSLSICEKVDSIVTLLNAKDCYKENDLLYKGKNPCKEDCAIPIKIADLGNSCWTHHQFTSDIQTLQYRCVETILKAPYGTASDIWSAACIAFELATGDFLFDPHASKEYSRSQHHLACFVELLGDIPIRFAKTGKLYQKFFNRKGHLRCQSENNNSIKELLIRRYKWSRREASNFAAFLEPMLQYEPQMRSSASKMLRQPWMGGLNIKYAPDNTIHSYSFDKPQD